MQDNEHFIFFNKNIENSSLTKSIFFSLKKGECLSTLLRLR
jgi:hypothetical protein